MQRNVDVDTGRLWCGGADAANPAKPDAESCQSDLDVFGPADQGYNTLEQGAGELNVDGAARIAKLVKTTLPTTNGSALLSAPLPSPQASTIAGETCIGAKALLPISDFSTATTC